ncbi:MAG: ComEC/Rec2 family competence protein [Clostridia bacterium]|nr:ComEC/Rec2 family competence protein [Clostridia bacterium]
MNRPMATIGFSLFFTLIAVGLLGYYFAFYIFFVLAALVALILILRRKNAPRNIIAILLSAMLGCMIFCSYTSIIYNRVTDFADREVTLKLEIKEIEGENNDVYYYVTEVVEAPHKALVGAKVRFSSSAPLDVEVCDYVSTNVVPKISGSHSESMHRYFKSDGIFLSAHTLGNYDVEQNPEKSLRYYFNEFKEGVTRIICANLDKESAAVVNSIFLGETSELDYKSNMEFRNIGISHIFSVSGLHVTLISAAIVAFLSLLIERKPVLYSLTLIAMWFFVAITGFSYSAIRAGVMLTVYYVGQMMYRKSDSINSLGVAITVICILNPYSATNVSVLYSFFATLGILIVSRSKFAKRLLDGKSKPVKMILETLLLSVGSVLFTLPVQIVFFNAATVISPLANVLTFIVIAPLMWCTIIAVVLSLFTGILSGLFFVICTLIAKYLIWISDLLASIPYATVDADRDFVKILVFIVIAVFLIVAYLNLGNRAIKGAFIICAVIVAGSILCYNIFLKPIVRVIAVDSGAATSVIVTYGLSAIVVGCGGSDYTATEIDSVLRQSGIDELRLLVLPSRQNSEAQNISGLLEKIDISEIMLGEEYGLIDSLGFENYKVVKSGKVIADNFEIDCLYDDEQRATFVKVAGKSVLIVSKFSDDTQFKSEWLNVDVIVSVGTVYPNGNAKINVLCTSENGNYPNATVCYEDGGNIIVEFFKDGQISCGRRE